MCLFQWQLSMTDTRHTEMASGQLPRIHQKGPVASTFAWHMDYHVWGVILETYHKLHSKPSQSLNSKKHCRWSGTACHRNSSTKLLKGSLHTVTEELHRSWQWTLWAQKVTIKHQTNCSLCYFSDAVLLCFGTNIFQHAIITRYNYNGITTPGASCTS